MNRICIVAAKRTPQGRFMGALEGKSGLELGKHAARAALQAVGAEQVDEVIVGCVYPAGQGMCLARTMGLDLGVPVDRPAFTVNMNCASGMLAAILAAQHVRSGEAHVVLCGGVESMSNAPYLLMRGRSGYRLGDGVLVDSLLRDGLVDSSTNEHMGLTAERLAEQDGISREEQDAYALRSHRLAVQAQAAGRFDDEIVPLDEVDRDEQPRPDTSLEKLASLRPVFKKDGMVTAGNASGLNDGAAMVVVCDERNAETRGWRPLATIRAWTTAGCDPKVMGLGPVHATEALCRKEDLRIADFDTVELNEAFAAQTLACVLRLGIDMDRVNPEGGAIALGHPVGASGARLVAHLAHRIARGETRRGLATLCVGGGMGAAMVLEPSGG